MPFKKEAEQADKEMRDELKPINWHKVEDALPKHNSDVVMLWSDVQAVRQGKYFDGESMLRGFAEPARNAAHYVGKVGVSHWCYLTDFFAGVPA